ncbi:hypothetical protein LCL96_11065 [Rossellomorea aquimaris]|uniref:competence protein CoiA n=1 Tax=Rossellomorea TaxID=2837508 RepID=UPI001CD3843B|nr:competence protein CoiA family protein [Rossellomorea aquimaris]MCA1059483.1 hypothetical protein [Rossellomorea aquimaris]
MLTALVNQKIFTTIHFTREDLKRVRSDGMQFQCPYCSSGLILRIGNRNVPHFAHVSHAGCIVEKENESPKHLLSKQLLYDRLNSLYKNVKLEHYLKEIKQIADIYVKTDDREIAIEIQCSTIPIPEMEERTHGYHRNGITPFWILTQSLKRKELLKLSTFQQAFIRYSPDLHYFLLHFLPEISSFHLYTHLYPVSNSRFLTEAPVTIPVDQITLPFTIPNASLQHPNPFSAWNHYRMKWIYNKLNYNKTGRDAFLREVYGEGDTFLYLPLYIGLPVIPHGMMIKNHEVEWQYYIWKDSLKKCGAFTVESVYHGLNKRLIEGHIELRGLPLIKIEEGLRNVVRGYLSLLEGLKVIERTDDQHFQQTNTWSCPNHFSAFEKHRHDFFPKWKHILKKV